MNTSIKFTFANGIVGGKPLIKIVQHESVFENDLISTSEQINPVDILAREFLSPEFEARNRLFKEELHICIPPDSPTHRITTLVPISEKNIAKELRWEIMGRYIPTNIQHSLENPVETNESKIPSPELIHYMQVFKKVNDFFDYVDGLNRPEHQVDFIKEKPKTVRWFFEMELLDQYRLKAFNNADKITLDLPAKNLFDAICISTHNDFNITKEGTDFWINAINESGYSI